MTLPAAFAWLEDERIRAAEEARKTAEIKDRLEREAIARAVYIFDNPIREDEHYG